MISFILLGVGCLIIGYCIGLFTTKRSSVIDRAIWISNIASDEQQFKFFIEDMFKLRRKYLLFEEVKNDFKNDKS
jgi:hypothetical protein